jgi:hypothetical protein
MTVAPIRGTEVDEPGAMFHVKRRCTLVQEPCVPRPAYLHFDRAGSHNLLRGPGRLLLARGAFAITGLAVIVVCEQAKHDLVFHVKRRHAPNIAALPQPGGSSRVDHPARGGDADRALLPPNACCLVASSIMLESMVDKGRRRVSRETRLCARLAACAASCLGISGSTRRRADSSYSRTAACQSRP